jgi:5-methylcytosine-specific restriction endonuclease McrA
VIPLKAHPGADLSADPKGISKRIEEELAKLGGEPATDKAVIKERIQSLILLSRATRQLSRYHLQSVTTAKAARDRILAYLKLFVKENVTAEELAVVAGIRAFPRRIRELRVEHGYKIFTGLSKDTLRPDEYVLDDLEPDEEEAKKWRVANTIRRQKGSGESRVLALLKHYVGKPLRGDELFYVAKIPSWRRRTGQLRTEKGWRVATRQTGREDLSTSEYVLENLEQLPAHDRKIEDEVYSEVLERDAHSCRRCSWNLTKRVSGDPKQFIELHHIEHHKQGGTNNKENLITLCNVCHDVAHKKNVTGDDFWKWLERK